jgi:hypothetical protein
MIVPIEEMTKLVGHSFPGGVFSIEYWENFLIHDVMLMDRFEDGTAHPLYLFHAPLAGLGVKIKDIFTLCQAESDEAVRAGEYFWEMPTPLMEGQTYRMSGVITGVERKSGKRSGLMDIVTFVVDITNEATGAVDARVTNSWIFLRRSG